MLLLELAVLPQKAHSQCNPLYMIKLLISFILLFGSSDPFLVIGDIFDISAAAYIKREIIQGQ